MPALPRSPSLRNPTASHADPRGEILNLLDEPVGSVSRIVSHAGAVRGNHYHKTDWHHCFVESGVVHLYQRAVGNTNVPEHSVFQAGDLFFTPPMHEHTMVFPEPGVLWCFARNPRDEASYEMDTVRIPTLAPPAA